MSLPSPLDEPSAAIRLDDVCFRYAGTDRAAIEGVSLEVEEKDLLGIIGPNGGGKSTLLRLILGLIEPQTGSLRVLGGSPHSARRATGYVPQQANIDPDAPATVLDMVLLGCLRPGLWGPFWSAADRDQALEALRRVDAADLATRGWSQLSGGQRQRALIARALVGEKKLLLLDEPTTGVDLHREHALLDLLHELNESMTILLVTHDLSLVASHARTALWLNRQALRLPAGELTVDRVESLLHGEGGAHHAHVSHSPADGDSPNGPA